MITSMSPSDLYITLIGRTPNYCIQEENSEQKFSQNADITDVTSGDRFEYSNGKKLNENYCYEISDAINFMEPDIQTELGLGYTNGLPTKERIAEYYGDIGKRLDAAYSEGKFTKEEYAELNNALINQVEKEITLTERMNAFYALGQKRGSLSPSAAGEAIRRQQSMTPEEWREERDSIIDDLVEKYYKIDRKSLWELFDAIRYGKSNN